MNMKNINELIVAKSLLYGGVLLLSLSSLLLFTYMRVPESSETVDVSAGIVAPASQDPPFGAVYKELKLKWPGTNKPWRVTNPNASREEAKAFLPNPILPFSNLTYDQEPFTISSEDLNDDVEKIEVIIDRWGGHKGTKDEKFRINGNSWYNIPDVPTLPSTETHDYYHHDNPRIVINKSDLTTGSNTIEGTTGHTSPAGWGQWGWTSVLIRIYYKEDTRDVAKGTVVIPSSFGENPEVKLNIQAGGSVTPAKVDYIGYYEGVDEDGDGYTTDWHEGYFSPKQIQEGKSFEISNHIGTSTGPGDFALNWDTRYVPDQDPGSIKIFARIKSSNGLTYVTQPVTNLSLNRIGSSVKIFYAQNVPPNFSSRKNNIVDVARVRIPAGFNTNSSTESVMFWRTWNGKDYDWGYNSYTTKFDAVNHGFHQSYYNVPKSALVAGSGANDGKIWIKADTEDHAAEVMWPGPALIIRTGELPPTLTPTVVVDSSPTPTPTVGTSTTPTPTEIINTPTAGPSPTMTVTPIFSPTPTATGIPTTPSITPTVSIIAGNICGKADVNGDGVFTIYDFSEFAKAYGQGSNTCEDALVEYGLCGGRDVNKDGKLNIADFGAQGIGFAQRYYPKESCSL
jgi:hypothetical protein